MFEFTFHSFVHHLPWFISTFSLHKNSQIQLKLFTFHNQRKEIFQRPTTTTSKSTMSGYSTSSFLMQSEILCWWLLHIWNGSCCVSLQRKHESIKSRAVVEQWASNSFSAFSLLPNFLLWEIFRKSPEREAVDSY